MEWLSFNLLKRLSFLGLHSLFHCLLTFWYFDLNNSSGFRSDIDSFIIEMSFIVPNWLIGFLNYLSYYIDLESYLELVAIVVKVEWWVAYYFQDDSMLLYCLELNWSGFVLAKMIMMKEQADHTEHYSSEIENIHLSKDCVNLLLLLSLAFWTF
jgi:hypothetical protein